MLADLSRQRGARGEDGEELGALERAVRWLGGALGEMGRAREALDFLTTRGFDQVVGQGESVEIEALLDPLRTRLARSIRFTSHDGDLGQVTLDECGRARLDFSATQVGVFEIKA